MSKTRSVGQTGERAVSTFQAGPRKDSVRMRLPPRKTRAGKGPWRSGMQQGTAKGTGTWGLRDRNASLGEKAPSLQAGVCQRQAPPALPLAFAQRCGHWGVRTAVPVVYSLRIRTGSWARWVIQATLKDGGVHKPLLTSGWLAQVLAVTGLVLQSKHATTVLAFPDEIR